MNKLKELCKQISDTIKYVPIYCLEQYKEFIEYGELWELINHITDLSNREIATVLDYTIKDIAYASIEPNLEVRKRYLSEAVKDLVSGMDEVEVLLKYEDILYRIKGWC